MAATTAQQRVLLLDNYDSFTYNLSQYLCELGAEVIVKRNDEISVAEIASLQIDRILISPGPGYPKDAGICCDVIRHFAGVLPISGVCLGLQCLFEVYGGTVGHADEIIHGKQSKMTHDGNGLFANFPSTTFQAVRYHSLVGLIDTLPQELQITCTLADNTQMIMGVRHKKYPIEAVQFHPESILSEHGKLILQNFLNMQ